jgi:hypothetical protein
MRHRGLGKADGGGTVATASKRHGRKGKGKRKIGRRGPLPHGGTPVVACGNRGAARQRRRRWPRCSGGGGGKLSRLGFAGEGSGCGLGETERAGRRLYRAAEEALTCRLGASRGRGGVGSWPDTGSSPSLALWGGDDPDRRDPPSGERERGCTRGWAAGLGKGKTRLLGWAAQ